MAKKTCGNCRHFAKEPDAGGRGCCFLSDDLGFYPVKGEHYAPCREWKPQTNWQRWFGTIENAAEFLSHGYECYRCPLMLKCEALDDLDCRPTMAKWLESEAE